MEGAPVTAATGSLGPVVAKLAALLGREYKLRRRTHKDIKFIRSKLKSMHTILWTIWEREQLDAASKDLKKEALDLADDMDDAVDDFILGMEEHSRSGNRRFIQAKIQGSPFEDFKRRANDVSERFRSKWKKKKTSRENAISSPSKPTPRASFVRKDVSQLVGLDGPRDKLIQHLVGNEESTVPVEPHLKMVAIVGMAGMGKTTLADLVYQAIGNKFQARAFVSVTPNPNMMDVLANILEQVAAGSIAPFASSKATKQEHLIDMISSFLNDKRYLVIIDDLWHCEEWEIIRKSLPENSLGSRLVTTTQVSAMAEKWRDHFDTLLYKMNPEWSDYEHVWRYNIDKTDVAEGMTAVNPDMAEEGFRRFGPVVYICGGVPLAHICMFSAVTSMVRQQQEQSGLRVRKIDMLLAIKERVAQHGIQSIPEFDPLIQSLKVSYDDLPHHMLRTCLLYCSMHYKGQLFHRDILITQWVAEGYVCKEEEAKGYFDELVSRGFIQPVGECDSLISRKYDLHPTLAEFLKWRSRENNFITRTSKFPSSYAPGGIRRLCIIYWPSHGSVEEEDLTSRTDWPHIRSLIVFSDAHYFPLRIMERLRVLNLGRSKSVEDHHLKDICGLFRLRHLLGVAGRDIRVIPPEIMRLQYLETLEVMETNIAELPREIGKLWRLKTLNVTSSEELKELPSEIGDLQHLETLRMGGLTGLKVLPWDIIARLNKLKTLDVSRNSWMSELPREIGNLRHLVTLDLSGTRITKLPQEIWKLHNLEELHLLRTRMTKIPREIGGLKKLKTLDLDWSIGTLPWEAVQLPDLVGVPECISQAWKKSSDLLSSLVGAGEMLSIHLNRAAGDRGGGLIVGTNHMHIPHWIGDKFKDLDLLDIRICKLEEKDIKILREMPNLKLLRLRLEVVPREPIAISRQGFSRLESLTVDSRVPRLVFQQGAMPKLCSLTLEFKFYGGPTNRDPLRIKNLQSLRLVELKWNMDWYEAKSFSAPIDVIRQEVQEHSNFCITFRVTGRDDELLPVRHYAIFNVGTRGPN